MDLRTALLTRRHALAAASAGIVAAASWRRSIQALQEETGRSRRDSLPRPNGPTTPVGLPISGAYLVAGSTREPDSLHPWLAGTAVALDVLDGVMDGLLRYTAEGKLRPALAESFSIDEDGVTYRFRLRQDVQYHNGEPFRGQDFVAAWELSLDQGFDALSTLGWQKVANVDLPDRETLVVTTTEPYAPFLSTVATTYICPRSALDDGIEAFREQFARAPIGTGPFRLANWYDGDAIELERWDRYWGVPAISGGIELQFFANTNRLLAALGRGDIDLAAGAGSIPSSQVDDALGLPDVEVFEHPTMNWQHIDLKQMSFLRETPVRQALDFATPREAIVADLLGGRASLAFADQSPVSWAYNDALSPRSFDPDRAASLLDEAGLVPGDDGIRVRDGRPFEIDLWCVAGDDLAATILDLVAAEWNALGISTLVQSAPANDLWGPLGYQYSDRMTGCLYTWTNANDPDDIYYWHSSQIPVSPGAPGGNLPAFFYPYGFQEEIDQLTADAALELDFAKRQVLYQDIQALLAEEVPVLFLYWEHAFPAARSDVGGVWPSAWTPLLWNASDWYLADPDATPAPRPTSTPTPMATPIPEPLPTATPTPATPTPTATPASAVVISNPSPEASPRPTVIAGGQSASRPRVTPAPAE